MNKYFLLALTLLLSEHALANNKDKPDKKLEPLSEAFLLFLAEMEDVDGELVHPIDLSKTNTKQLNNSNKTPEQTNKDGKKHDGK